MSTKLIKNKQQLSSTQLKLTFQGEGMDPAFVNALRRILMGEVPSYSLVGELTINQNTSVFNNQYLENRVKLLPMYITKPLPENLICYLADPDDPSQPLRNNQNDNMDVTAHDFQIYDETTGNRMTKLDIRELIFHNFPLLKLRKGQEFHLSVKPQLGRGFQHATFKSCGVKYKWENQVSLGQIKNRSVSPITNQPNETIEDKRNYPQNQWENPDTISLTIEENGHYPALICFQLALDTLEQKLRIFKNLVDQKDPTRIEIIEQKGIVDYLQLKVIDPDELLVSTDPSQQPLATHTLGNLLADHMYYQLHNKIKGDLNQLLQSNTSYRLPHPLDTVMYFHIKTPSKLYQKMEERLPGLQLLMDTLDTLLKQIQKLRQEFGK